MTQLEMVQCMVVVRSIQVVVGIPVMVPVARVFDRPPRNVA